MRKVQESVGGPPGASWPRLAALVGLLVSAAVPAADAGSVVVEQYSAIVIAVEDGDTLTVLKNPMSPGNHRIRENVRLTDIDAPEVRHGHTRPGQPYGQSARRALQTLALGKVADLDCYADRTYDRPVCRVFVAGVDVGRDLVRRGLAHANHASRRYVRDPEIYNIESQARMDRRGLWAEGNPMAPWDWRRSCWQNGICSATVP